MRYLTYDSYRSVTDIPHFLLKLWDVDLLPWYEFERTPVFVMLLHIFLKFVVVTESLINVLCTWIFSTTPSQNKNNYDYEFVLCIQLTTKAVETDHSHNRLPFFLCGSVTEKESTIIVNTPVSNSPFPLKPPERGRYSESFRDLLSKSRIAYNQMIKASTNDCQILG